MMAKPQKKKVSAMTQGPGRFLQKSVVLNEVQPSAWRTIRHGGAGTPAKILFTWGQANM